MTARKDHTRYLVVARDGDDHWHPVRLGTLTPRSAALMHIDIQRRQGVPDRCQIWTQAQWLTYDSKQVVDVWAQGE
ncbi:MAG: hypothetical protein ACLQUT_12755 [Thermoleophilia bacterium]